MPAKKNVLLIVVDQWRGLMLPKLGANYLKLPNIDRLCAEGVTTRGSASDVSGRGVGMASFRERIKTLQGRLEVRSAKGVGTSWFVRFRWPVKSAPAVPRAAAV